MNTFLDQNKKAMRELGMKLADMLELTNVGTKEYPEFFVYDQKLKRKCTPDILVRVLQDNMEIKMPNQLDKPKYNAEIKLNFYKQLDMELDLGEKTWEEVADADLVQGEAGLMMLLIFDDMTTLEIPVDTEKAETTQVSPEFLTVTRKDTGETVFSDIIVDALC